MGGVAKTVKKALPAINPITFVGSKIKGSPLHRAADSLGLGDPTPNNGGSGGFTVDPMQLEADKAAIGALTDKTFDNTRRFIDDETATRKASRDQLAQALIRQSQNSFQQGLPGTLEDLNARNLLNGSGVGQEIARQQAEVATNIADQVGILGAQDIDWATQARQGNNAGRNAGLEAALQRQFSLQDFISQANVAKTIGAQMAPQVNNGKGNVVGGFSAGAAAGAPFGPWGAILGGGAGAALGSGSGRGK